MADVISLLNTEIHQVQDQWPGKKELHTANCAAMNSAKEVCYFQVVSPTKAPKIKGLKGIHSPEALKHQSVVLFSPWCNKEGQNEGTVVNHLCADHYHLGLICKRCLQFFTPSSDMMQHHVQGCQPTCAHGDSSDDEDPGARDGGDGNKPMWNHMQVNHHHPEAPYSIRIQMTPRQSVTSHNDCVCLRGREVRYAKL